MIKIVYQTFEELQPGNFCFFKPSTKNSSLLGVVNEIKDDCFIIDAPSFYYYNGWLSKDRSSDNSAVNRVRINKSKVLPSYIDDRIDDYDTVKKIVHLKIW